MTRLELSEAADADLASILSYGVEVYGEGAAEAYVESFEAAFALISDWPAAGAVHEEVRPPIRSRPHGSHRIFYDILEDRVIVQRILHQAMDVERHL